MWECMPSRTHKKVSLSCRIVECPRNHAHWTPTQQDNCMIWIRYMSRLIGCMDSLVAELALNMFEILDVAKCSSNLWIWNFVGWRKVPAAHYIDKEVKVLVSISFNCFRQCSFGEKAPAANVKNDKYMSPSMVFHNLWQYSSANKWPRHRGKQKEATRYTSIKVHGE